MNCDICYSRIISSEAQVECPFCKTTFHKNHLAYWLLTRNTCPICRTVYSDEFLADFRPKTVEERIEIEKSELEIINNINKRKKRRTIYQWVLIIPFFFVELYLAAYGQYVLIIILLAGFLFLGIPKGEKSHYKVVIN